MRSPSSWHGLSFLTVKLSVLGEAKSAASAFPAWLVSSHALAFAPNWLRLFHGPWVFNSGGRGSAFARQESLILATRSRTMERSKRKEVTRCALGSANDRVRKFGMGVFTHRRRLFYYSYQARTVCTAENGGNLGIFIESLMFFCFVFFALGTTSALARWILFCYLCSFSSSPRCFIPPKLNGVIATTRKEKKKKKADVFALAAL